MPLRAGDGVRGTGDVRDAAVAESVQVGKREPYAFSMVRADVGGAPGASDVDADERHATRREVGDQGIVAVDADENGCIEAMLGAGVGRLEQEWVEARLRKPARDGR